MKQKESINQQVNEHQSAVNIDEIWAAIEPEVDRINAEKRKRRGALWIFWGGTLVLGLGLLAGAYFWLDTTDKTTIGETSVPALIEETTASPTKPSTAPTPVETSKQGKSTSSNTLDTSIANTNTNAASFSDQSVAKGLGLNTNRQDDLSVQTKVSTPANSNVTTPVLEPEELTTTVDRKASNTSWPVEIQTTKNSASAIGLLSQPTIYLSNKLIEVSPFYNYDDLLPLTATKTKSATFSVNAYAGISYPQRTLFAKQETEYTSIVINARNATETVLEAQHYGVAGTFQLASGWSLSTGVEQTTITERYDFTDKKIEEFTTEGVLERVIQLNGDTLDRYGDVTTTTTYDYEKQIYNRYSMLDIPVLLGYEWQKQKWNIGAQAGVYVNMSLATSGQIQNGSPEDFDIAVMQEVLFKQRLGVSYYAGVRATRQFDNGLEVFAAPFIRILDRDISTIQYAVGQRYQLYGIKAGAGWRF